jgi:hypothetical protein
MKSKYSTTLCLLCGAYIAKGAEIRKVGGAWVPRRDENSPYSPPMGDEQAGMEDCPLCLGEGRVPVFEEQDGVRMPVGYRACDCVAEE